MGTPPLKPKDLIPEDDTTWNGWYNSNKSAQDILGEIKNQDTNRTFTQRVLPQQIIWYGHRIGAILANNKLKYAQLRRFVDALKDIAALDDWNKKLIELTLFQVQLVHGYSRKAELEPFFTVIKGIIEKDWIKSSEDFERFMALIDSITAHFEIFEDKSKNE